MKKYDRGICDQIWKLESDRDIEYHYYENHQNVSKFKILKS